MAVKIAVALLVRTLDKMEKEVVVNLPHQVVKVLALPVIMF